MGNLLHLQKNTTYFLCLQCTNIQQRKHMLELTLIKLNTYTEMHLKKEKNQPLSYSLEKKRYILYFFNPVRNLSNRMVSSWVVRMWAAAVIITKGLSTAWAWETTCSAVLSSCHPHQLTINMEGCTHALRGSLTGFLESGTTTQQGSGNWVMWGIRNPQQLCSS